MIVGEEEMLASMATTSLILIVITQVCRISLLSHTMPYEKDSVDLTKNIIPSPCDPSEEPSSHFRSATAT